MIKKAFAIILSVLIMVLSIYASVNKNSDSIIFTSTQSAKIKPTIIIDAGHGGFDGGCSGADGTLEKDINLAISLKLDRLLKSLGFKTILIRDSDTAVNTEDGAIRVKKVSDIMHRYKVMKENPESIYLCIHQNQYSSSTSHGAQIFYSPNDTMSKSLAENIQASIIQKVQTDNKRQVKKCTKDVYLIYHATTYAVLVECGFLSNQSDLSNLKTDKYQQKISFAITCGLLDWLNSN